MEINFVLHWWHLLIISWLVYDRLRYKNLIHDNEQIIDDLKMKIKNLKEEIDLMEFKDLLSYLNIEYKDTRRYVLQNKTQIKNEE